MSRRLTGFPVRRWSPCMRTPCPGKPRQGRETTSLRQWAGEWEGAGKAGEGVVPGAGRPQLASWEGQEVDKTPGHSQHPLLGISGAGSWLCGPHTGAPLTALPISHVFFSGLADAHLIVLTPTFQDPQHSNQEKEAAGEPGLQPAAPPRTLPARDLAQWSPTHPTLVLPY